MNAFIYAAGRATRLGPANAGRPKILIEVGGRTLLDWHVQRLTEAGIRRLTIVTGYEHQMVTEALPELRTRHGIEIEEIVNPNFTEGSVISFHVSLPRVLASTGPVLLMDGDVFYPAKMLRRLIQSPHSTVLLIDCDYSTDDDDPVLVPIRQGKPFEFRKRWHGKADQIGESIGFFKVDATDLPRLAEETERRTVGIGRLDSYDEVLRSLVRAGRFAHEDVTGLAWTEIDFPKDVEFARNVVLPAISEYEAAEAARNA